ncbi:FAD-dependent oxidoreductase [Paraburkholderia diazotrophica]|uniref:Choline dehydrogenase n=1 Tax=Paraburkholderia diazotrophica TaxID=667676 RepID=A0A1H7D4E4_9BURK|nr:GMC family oxidoreductase [Paraburkholderia diazotrophica]SEJ96681.1 Choline dehydrogenase [Paraburkholderia diazotrophica]
MFIDTRSVEEGVAVSTTVCIIGAGVAGITLAMELDRAGIECCLLESGGYKADDDTRDLYRGDNVGIPYTFADGCRSRYLGGSSNCWGGWCRPLDPWDFDKKDWVANSGWPFGLDELTPYYQRTHTLLKLGPDNFDPAWWEQQINRHDVRRYPLVSGNVRDTVSQFSPPVRFGKVYREVLRRSERVRVFLYANVVNIDTDSEAKEVTGVDIATLSGKRVRMNAKLFVLATGGIENARLLLASNKVQAAGLGNGNDLVGRFFMDHPRLMAGTVKFSKHWARNKLYDIKYHYQNPAVAAHGQQISSQFALTQDVIIREKLLNSRVWFFSRFFGEGSAGSEALIRCREALHRKEQPGRRARDDYMTMAMHPIDTIGFGLTRLLQLRALISDVKLQAIVEAEPNRDSRVTLSDRKDRLGLPRVKVDWRLTELVQRTFDRTFQLLADELKMTGVGEVELDEPLTGRTSWPAKLEGTWHHMGTTRMHDSPREGVVDRDCKMHGVSNLYIAGSSVFPTVGANFPTITISALALRLSTHLVQRLGKPDTATVVPIGEAANARFGNVPNPEVSTLPIAAQSLVRAGGNEAV